MSLKDVQFWGFFRHVIHMLCNRDIKFLPMHYDFLNTRKFSHYTRKIFVAKENWQEKFSWLTIHRTTSWSLLLDTRARSNWCLVPHQRDSSLVPFQGSPFAWASAKWRPFVMRVTMQNRKQGCDPLSRTACRSIACHSMKRIHWHDCISFCVESVPIPHSTTFSSMSILFHPARQLFLHRHLL